MITRQFNQQHAVSPVVGVILMIAVTVILAGIIAVFVFGFTDTFSDTTTAGVHTQVTSSDIRITVVDQGSAERIIIVTPDGDEHDVNIPISTIPLTSPGRYTVIAIGDDGTRTVVRRIDIGDGDFDIQYDAPTILIDEPSEVELNGPTPVSFDTTFTVDPRVSVSDVSVTVLDPDSTPLTVATTVDGLAASHDIEVLTAGLHTIEATVTDSEGQQATAHAQFEVVEPESSDPEITSLRIVDAHAACYLSFEVEVTNNGDAGDVTFDLYVNENADYVYRSGSYFDSRVTKHIESGTTTVTVQGSGSVSSGFFSAGHAGGVGVEGTSQWDTRMWSSPC